ncbi:uncharacterized protein PAC_00044 [Phialocephala subalpina]|uniref:C6 finger domain protein n=1 Tax=Phialocephala subalpina TaxID=576137 RepID=A0A1L7WBL8_9HELO|nr:uncharacterized protein PAC_00044 [Phialocephala subalpina]
MGHGSRVMAPHHINLASSQPYLTISPTQPKYYSASRVPPLTYSRDIFSISSRFYVGLRRYVRAPDAFSRSTHRYGGSGGMLTRRHHQKSRTGCMTCKQKKVKLKDTQSTNHPLTRGINTPELDTLDLSALNLDDSTCAFTMSPHLSTSQTFSSVPDRRYVWERVVPQIAFSHGFLLHGLLALTALHLSQISPERKDSLWASASTHHATALPMFRSAVKSINSLNCHACSAFGTLVTVYEWASIGHASNLFFANTEHPIEASTIEWVQLLRGSAKIVYYHYEEIMKGPLEPVLRWDNTAELEAEANPAESAKFSALEQLWDSTRVPTTAAEVDSLKEALRWLRIIYTMMSTPNSNCDPASTALSWPVRVPEHFLSMVNERQPAALILLSHFCLLLNKVEDFWWIRGMSRRLLQEITQTLGEEWETWIGWPLQDLVLSEFRNQHPGESIRSVPVIMNNF